MHRVALGFRVAGIPELVAWPAYYGYATAEGRELNETAIAAGDDPADWYICETPVDVLKVAEFWGSSGIIKPKLQRRDSYIRDIHRMVTLCREHQAYIPPSWLSHADATVIARKLGVPVA